MVIFLQSCATKTSITDQLVKDSSGLPTSIKIDSIPFIKQTQNHCGPASLAMILKAKKYPVDIEKLSAQMMTPGKEGTFTTDVISAVRRQGMIPVKITDLKSVLTEISQGQPVLVFQNLGFSWYPNWHYAVALGFDLTGPDIILHSGEKKFQKMDMRMFERSWSLTNNWALVVLQPGALAATADDLEHVFGISGLEVLEKFEEAQLSYETVLKKWPQSLAALIGMGNVLYAKEDFQGSASYLIKATTYHPLSRTAWHNLATAQGANGQLRESQASALKAISLAKGKSFNIDKL